MLDTARRHGFTPLQLREHANDLLGKGIAPPEPRIRELVMEPDSPLLGTAALDDVLRRPFTPADLRAATMTWPLHEVFDAIVDADALPAPRSCVADVRSDRYTPDAPYESKRR